MLDSAGELRFDARAEVDFYVPCVTEQHVFKSRSDVGLTAGSGFRGPLPGHVNGCERPVIERTDRAALSKHLSDAADHGCLGHIEPILRSNLGNLCCGGQIVAIEDVDESGERLLSQGVAEKLVQSGHRRRGVIKVDIVAEVDAGHARKVVEVTGRNLVVAFDVVVAVSLKHLLPAGLALGIESFVLKVPLGLDDPGHLVEDFEQFRIVVCVLNGRNAHHVRHAVGGSAEPQEIAPRVGVDWPVARTSAQRSQHGYEIHVGGIEAKTGLIQPMRRHPGTPRTWGQQHMLEKCRAKSPFPCKQIGKLLPFDVVIGP